MAACAPQQEPGETLTEDYCIVVHDQGGERTERREAHTADKALVKRNPPISLADTCQ